MNKKIIRLGLVIFILGVMVTGYGGLCKKDDDDDVVTGSSGVTIAAPSNLVAAPVAPVASFQIDLSWTDNAVNEDNFKIERKTGAAGVYAEIEKIPGNSPSYTSYSDTGLVADTTYYYRVRAYNLDGRHSMYSNEASATAADVPNSLTFVQQPTTANIWANIAPAVTIEVKDQNNNVVASVGVSVTTTTLLNGTTTQVSNASGIATFNNLNITTIGYYALTATYLAITQLSGDFGITAEALDHYTIVPVSGSVVTGTQQTGTLTGRDIYEKLTISASQTTLLTMGQNDVAGSPQITYYTDGTYTTSTTTYTLPAYTTTITIYFIAGHDGIPIDTAQITATDGVKVGQSSNIDITN